jgi:ankyrin repeat protein
MADNGNDPDDWQGREKLHIAAVNGDLVRLQELVAAGWSVDAFDDLGMTPLHYACQYEHQDAALFLIRSGANVNAHDDSKIGQTPLGNIAGSCSLAMAKLLVKAGANPLFKPSAITRSALAHAKNRKRGEGPRVYELLRSAAERFGCP